MATFRPTSRSFRRSTAALALLAVAAVGLVPPNASAHDGEPPDSGEKPVQRIAKERAASEATDAGIIAAKRGWTVDAARQRMRNQVRFGGLVDRIAAAYPTTFAGAEFTPTPTGVSYIRFKGTVPATASQWATASKLKVSLTGGRAFSARQLAARATAVGKFFYGAGYRNGGVVVMPDGTLQVALKGAAKPGVGLPTSLRQGTKVTYTTRAVAKFEHTYGGAYIHSSGSQCTSGFSVRHETTGETGVATAEHCENTDHYHQPQSNTTYDLLFEDQHLGIYGDMQWFSTASHVELAEYYANVTDLREVNSVETSTAVNNTYCVYSRMQSTRNCDDVHSTYVVFIVSNGVSSDHVGMDDDDNAIGGDSGGPWSLSNEAAGIHTGNMWIPFNTMDCWSKAWLLDNAMDVDVMTQ